MTKFEQFKQCVDEVEMTKKIVEMMSLLDLNSLDKSIKGILILQYLRQDKDL